MKAYTAVTVGVLFSVSTITHAGWTDDWFSSAVVTGPGSYNNQQRGFYTAGSFQGRLTTATDHPITVTLPKLKSGCGGVDLFLGGMSFLDEDYLVQKFQNIIQAAPALAFDIALKVMAKELATSMKGLEGATNWLNNLQLDDCAISNRIVTAVSEDDPDVLGAAWNEITSGVSLESSINKSWDEAQKDIQSGGNNPILDLKDEIADCPSDFKDIFSSGSLIENATTLFGVPGNASIIRGYIGDVYIKADPTDMIPIVTRIESCPANDRVSVDDILEGNARAKQTDGTCTLDNTRSIREIVSTVLDNLAVRMVNNQQPTADQVTFIDNSSLPVYSILLTAVRNDNVDSQISLMTDLVSADYAYRIFDDLYRNMDYMFRKVRTISSVPGVDSSATGDKCDTSVFKNAIAQFGEMQESVRSVRRDVHAHYANKKQILLNDLEFAQMMKARRDDADSANTLRTTN